MASAFCLTARASWLTASKDSHDTETASRLVPHGSWLTRPLMKILFITSRFPYPPVRGDKIRAFNLMRELAKNHEVLLASFATAEDGGNYVKLKEYIPRIERAVFKPWRAYANCLTGLFTKIPLQVHYYRSPAMRDAVAKLVDEVKPDVIHAHLIRTATYALAYPDIPKVLDICDSMTLNYDRMLAYRRDAMSYIHRLERPRTRMYESTTPLLFDANTVVSTHDRDYIKSLAPVPLSKSYLVV